MGEVYKARDTKLNRDVALKVLPELLATDPERLARLRREAQVLASLNHPNIAAIFGFEETGAAPALVMELVDGRTLADVAGAPMPIAEVTAVARQIVEALEAAHEAGVIHRDLKPANIKVRDDGTVKILDFGLAKAMGADGAASGPDPSNSPTLTGRATQIGVILGTAAYMAPEQAKGRAVDKRADIWAFGVVLYEMLTGRRAFEGEDVSETLAAVLTREPDFSAVPASAPGPLVAVMRRCLERDPKRRLRDMGEARLALEAPMPDRSATAASTTAASTPRGVAVWRGAAAALTAALLVVSALWWQSASSRGGDAVHAALLLPRDVSFDFTLYPVLAMSDDGSKVALVGSQGGIRRLYVRRLGEFEARLLDGTEDAASPFFSPNGSWIAFFAGGRLKKVLADGGPVVDVAAAPDNRGGVWAGDDTIIYAPAPASPVVQVAAAGGKTTPVSTLDEAKRERTHRWPSMFPDGKTVLVTVGSVEHPDDYDDARIESVRLGTGERHVVIEGGRMARYVATGHLLYLRGKVLYAVPFDAARGTVSGSAVPVIDGVSGDVITGAGNYALSGAGAIAYVPGDPTGGARQLAWVDRKGVPTPIDAPPGLYTDPHVAPDGRYVALSLVAGSHRDLYVVDTARGTSSQLTSEGENRTPLWSPGSRLVYIAYDRIRNVSTVMRRLADGSGGAESFAEVAGQAYAEDLTRDGGTLLLSANSSMARGVFQIFRLPLTKGSKPELIASAPDQDVYQPAISPDGRWLAYASYESTRVEVYVQAYPSGGNRQKISTAGGIEPRWATDGKALFYTLANSLMIVPVEPGTAFLPGKPRMLFAGLTSPATDSGQTYSVDPKGERFLMLRPVRDGAGPPEVRVILNWFNALRALKIGK
jgi:serine/threonine-protein kinase